MFRKLLNQINREFQQCYGSIQVIGKPFDLGEIFCSDQSPLTQQVQSLGGKAFRYGYAQCDLATPGGRQQLFRSILTHRPKHLWYSPTCGPWSSWSNLNASRSMESYDQYQEARSKLLYTIALGIILHRHQIMRGCHFHWEQPARSLMFHVPELAEIFEHARVSEFDMCRAGGLVDPSNGKPMKKGMNVITSSPRMFQALHGQLCNHQHAHQPIEGTTHYKGMNILRSTYSEVYPRRFARTVAKSIISTKWERPFNWHQLSPLLRTTSHSAEVFVGTTPQAKPKFPLSEIVTPPSRSEVQVKRRRLEGKQAEEMSMEQLQEMFARLDSMVPRVGKKEITDEQIQRTLSDLFKDKRIIRIVACRGTDRTIAPPSNLNRLEAPYRRSIMIMRDTGAVRYEANWERWDGLAQRQIVRPSHKCRIRVTVFGSEIATSSQSVPVTAPSTAPVVSMPAAPDTEMSPETPQVPVAESDVPATIPPSEVRSQDQGARFKALPTWEQSMILRMHKNLGHPSNDLLAQALQTAKYRPEIVQAAAELKCAICSQHSQPKHQRPATLKPNIEFNTKIYIDKVSWTNKQGKILHFYHMLDAGSNYHVAIASPSGTTPDVIRILQQHWISWAGPPQEVVVDSASELNSEEFANFLQRFNIKGHTIPPEAHWQNGKAERHGGFLQQMLQRIESEHPIDTYDQLQESLNQSTHAKNALSIRHGYAPEVIVFGKHSRIPGSVLSDESLPSHTQAIQEEEEHRHDPASFRRMLSIRESARKAFHEADNSDSLRRAMLRRSCPSRGQFSRNQWVMIWKSTIGHQQWIGPHRVVLQDGSRSVWTVGSGKLYQRAPEHVRLSHPEEGTPDEIEPQQFRQMEQQIQRLATIQKETPTDDIPTDNNPPAVPDHPVEPREEQNPETDNSPHTDNTQVTLQQPESEQQSQQSDNINTPEQSDSDQLLCYDDEAPACFSTEDQPLAWRCEINVPHHSHTPSHHEALAMLVSSSKKQRSEVRLTQLSPSEREEFEQAKSSEIANWINTGTISTIFRDQVSPEQILKCRWILTWKPLDSAEQAGHDSADTAPRTCKAKARLVVLGYLDPNIEEIPRDSPTLNRTSRMLILQVIASMGYTLQSFDIKAAFLQGEPQSDRVMALDPVPELRKALQMDENQVAKLNKGAYGLVDAPYLWYQALVAELTRLNFTVSPFDPCTFILREPPGSDRAGQVAGILGIHVDDGLGGGNTYFQQQIDKLEKKYPFGSKKTGAFTFTGIDLQQQNDKSIILSQSNYINKIPPIAIESHRKTQSETPVTEQERLALRGLIGSLQYASVNTRPDIASRLSLLQSAINKAKVSDLQEANRLLHETKRHHDVQIVIKPIPIESFRFMAFSDASFASVHKPSSHTGSIIVGTHSAILQNHQCPISPIAWGCKKIQRVVTSTLAAESTALSSTLDQLAWLRLYWSWIHNPNTTWKNPDVGLQQVPPAITVPTIAEQCDLAITDCKSLYDLITRTAPPQCSEFRVQLVARAIKEALSEGIRLRWVHSGAQLADSLTKAMDSRFLRETLRLGEYKLCDEDSVLRERAKTKDRVKWLKNTTSSNDPISMTEHIQYKTQKE
eukprot:Skav210812  [mRNA]  locus=scaffold2924:156234:161009:- [translate_table: standard]